MSLLLCGAVFLASLIVHIPAALVLSQAPLPPALKISGVSGTLWAGQADSVRWQNLNLGAVEWSLNVSSLLTGELEAHTRFGRGSDLGLSGKGIIGYSLSGQAYAQNLMMSLPADTLLPLMKVPVPVSLDGQLELTLKSFEYAEPYCRSATGSLAWSNGNLISPVGELSPGPVIAQLQCQDNQIKAQGQQQNGQLSAQFSASLNASRSYQAQGWFKPGAEFPQSLIPSLQWMPAPDNQGRYAFRYQGRL